MTLVKNDNEMLPITSNIDKTVIMTAYDNEILSVEYTAFSADAELTGTLPVNIPSLDENYTYSSNYLYERGYGLQYTNTT